MKKNSLIVIFIALLCGCASTEANLQRESARSIGKGLSPDQVAIANIKRGMANVSWTAETPKGKFKCSADDMVRRVNCVK
jgi:hypothetical protein